MSEVEEGEDKLFRERVRDAIQAGGKSGIMSTKTGIPVGTLNKYVALRSVPSATNALKIAKAVGLTVEELASGRTVHGAGGDSRIVIIEDEAAYEVRELETVVAPGLLEKLYIGVEQTYKGAGQKVPGHKIANEAAEMLNKLKRRVADINDDPVVDAVMPVLLQELKKRLAEARAEPGTGKRLA